jgi:hypothetical protein
MGFTSILALIIIAILTAVIYMIIQGIKNKNWKQVIITIVAFALFIAVFSSNHCSISSMHLQFF